MKSSWLIQRLNPSRSSGSPDLSEVFSFGGGLRNGGLSNEAMDLLRSNFSFDYMGAAEFEFGAVPKALQTIAQDAGRLTAAVMRVSLAEVRRHWRDKSTTEPSGEAPVYILCAEGDLNEVIERIQGWATGAGTRLAEATYLTDALRPDASGGYVPETCGWLELDNGFFFFTDAGMWQRTCELFGVDARAATA